MAAHVKNILRSQTRPRALWNLARPVLCADTSLNVGERGQQPVRGMPTSKHYALKWRTERKKKILKVDIPKLVELKKDREKNPETPDEMRMKMKKEGRHPPRTFQELPMNISCTRTLIEEYKPPEGDGKQSMLSTTGIKDRVTKGAKSMRSIRKLKKYEDFDEADFASQAQDIVVEVQHLLQDVYKNQEKLHDLVTEHAFPGMVHGLETKSMRWKFAETVEPPKVVQVRTEEVLSDGNMFAQVTVRMHTKQTLAIYDRFGRLMYGDPLLPKSVVEYVVMEKWISDTYGKWRVHGKIMPDWMPQRDSIQKTYKVPTFGPLPPLYDLKETDKKETSSEESEDKEDDGKPTDPKLALA